MKKEPKKEIKKEEPNLTKLRDEQLIPIAREMLLSLAAREDLMIGGSETLTTEQASKYYQEKYLSIVVPILIKHNIRVVDIDYLFQLMGQPVNFLKEITTSSFHMNRARADALLYDIKDIDELKVNELDTVLKKHSKKVEKK